jgi:integration host factor subunit beta
MSKSAIRKDLLTSDSFFHPGRSCWRWRFALFGRHREDKLLRCLKCKSTHAEPLTMSRSELVARLAAHFHLLTVKDAEASVSTILSAISEALAEGHRVEVRGFGAFVVNYRPPRKGRNPSTGASVSLPEKHVPHFKPGKEMRNRVAGPAAGAKPSAGKIQKTQADAELLSPV